MCCLGKVVEATLPNVAAGERQAQLPHFYDLRASSPTCHRQWRGISSPTHTDICQMRGRTRSPMLTFSGKFTCNPVNRVRSTVLPRRGAGPAPPSAAVGGGWQVQLSHFRTSGPALSSSSGVEEVRTSLPHPCHFMVNEGKAKSPMLEFSMSARMCSCKRG